MQPLRELSSRTVVLARNDVDTDQIIPARFLTTTSREGLGDVLFADWRFVSDGSPNPEFELNQAHTQGAEVLVAGRNFGCGSSREHAPWALLDYGFRAVVSSEIADIFYSNSLKNGLLPVRVSDDFLAALISAPATVQISVEHTTIEIVDGDHAGRSETFPLDGFARFCLLEGTDQLGYLLDQQDEISGYERRQADEFSPGLGNQ